ncbi:hypothetical protein [Massilia sp. CFBP9026]|uniref:hypothetical protein n=1 Tax=Massilia sp. CFBP9026 TaxID=3096536 RepID=UPI002A6A332D|nr:hypothetical protein [Massilia sp. CFBP9026]MDY0964448.1 hypothetical protein [Massilia sp. CFBP9026]
MTFLRTIIALSLTCVLAACGGQYDIDTTVQSASTTVIASAPASVSAAAAPVATVATVASATMPAPDCAAEGCASLRIIDGNAEAWRIDAQRRAALEASLPQT